jgi:hypothetical protein
MKLKWDVFGWLWRSEERLGKEEEEKEGFSKSKV